MLWAILFTGLMIWARFGAAGLEGAATVGAMFVGGLGVRSFLNTFWTGQKAEGKKAEAPSVPNRPRENRYRKGLFHPRPEHLRREVR
jgi:hypothetical protein